MANRFWVGGTNTWDATAGTKWSTTSGGAGGASVPGVSDDVFFNAASGTCTVTLGADVSVISVDFYGNISFNASTYNITTAGTFAYGFSSPTSFLMGSGLWTIGGNLNITSPTATSSAGTANIKMLGNGGVNIGLPIALNQVWFVGTGSSGTNPVYLSVDDGCTISELKLSAGCFVSSVPDKTTTINSFTSLGTSGNKATITTINPGQVGEGATYEIVNPGTGYSAADYMLLEAGSHNPFGLDPGNSYFEVATVDGNGAVLTLGFVGLQYCLLPGDIITDTGTGGATGTGFSVRILTISDQTSRQSHFSKASGNVDFTNTNFYASTFEGGATFKAPIKDGNLDLGYNSGIDFSNGQTGQFLQFFN